ncbi:AraC family transcriptional regulator [uncultured Tateyamaria sp.]|uniref:AraC family transcriptional regulator n=1 Tax=uncultured Tateyamaria sp. TaxID=455651 RepID=UPI00260B1085|nr:AraC family transcriptional regulator [uncultured Tateyamaria sp.]
MHSASSLPVPASDGSYDALYGSLYADFPQAARQIGTPRFSMIKAQQNSHATTDPSVPQLVLRSLSRSGMTHNTVDCGDGVKSLSTVPGSFYVAPPNAIADWESDGKHDISLLAIPHDYVSDLLETNTGEAMSNLLDPILNTQLVDPALDHMMEQIWSASVQDSKGAALQADGLLLTMMGRLVAHADERSKTRVKVSGTKPLDPARLKRVVDYIEAHLGEVIAMPDLAQVACLSQHHFARVFRAATGMSPHAYVTQKRIEHAQTLLLTTNTPLVQVALICGFGTQAHFSTVFKKLVGVPPKRFQSERRRERSVVFG